MQMQEYLRYHIIMMVSVGANESVLSFIDEVRRWALIFLDKLYATINMPALKELSRMFQNLLLHSKIQLLNEHLESSALLLSLIGCAIATTILWRMLWAGFRVEKTAFKIVDADAAKSARFSWGSVYGYFRSLVDWLLKGLILFCCVLIITTGLFIICKTLWFSYVASPVGRLYPVYFPQRARLMGMVLGQDIIVFPIMLTILSFGAGLICAAGCRFFT